jgi:hypothetical protein
MDFSAAYLISFDTNIVKIWKREVLVIKAERCEMTFTDPPILELPLISPRLRTHQMNRDELK